MVFCEIVLTPVRSGVKMIPLILMKPAAWALPTILRITFPVAVKGSRTVRYRFRYMS